MKTQRTPLFALSLLCAALSACATLPKAPNTVLAEPNLPLDQHYDISVNDTQTISSGDVPSIAAIGWQEFYADDKLKALIALGLENNKSLEQATLAIEKAKAQYQISDSALIPSIGSSAGYTRRGSEHSTSGTYTVGLAMPSYEIDLWGKVHSLKDQALQSFFATAAARDAAQISLIANIAQAYVNISYAKAQLMLAESTAESRAHSLYITQRRFQAGIDSRMPSLQAQSSLEEAKLAVLRAQTNLLKAENALQYLIGAPIPNELMPESSVTDIVNPKVFNTGLPSELLFYRPDIAAAEYRLKAAGANINIARAAYFPSISLSGNLGLSSSSLNTLFKSGAFGWSFGPSVSLPIFDAGLRRANYETAVIDQQSALANYEDKIQNAFREVHDVLAERSTINQQIQAQYKQQDNYQQSYQIANATFRSGLSGYLEVLESERSLFAVQQSIFQLEQQRVLSQVALYQVLGGGASLAVPKVMNAEQQVNAMSTANLATAQQAQAMQSERSPVDAATAVARHDTQMTAPTAPISDGSANTEGDESILIAPPTTADTPSAANTENLAPKSE